MGISLAEVCNGIGGITGGEDIRLLPLEHIFTIYCDQTHYGPVSGGGVEAIFKGVQAVVGSVRTGFGKDADSGLVSGTERGWVGDRQDGGGNGLNKWEYNVSRVTLGTDPNAPLAYAPALELHHPIISKLLYPRVQLDRGIEGDCIEPLNVLERY